MTRSRSTTKASRAWVILVALLLLTGVASAGRKRVVVLELDGEKAEKFHADLVKLIKKSHTVVSVDKWNGTAEEMSAAKLTDKNVKKVAKKLKVDGVVSGTVEKRRDEYILRLKLRAGVSGALVGSQINIKSESAKLDGTAAKDVKDELIDAIADLESNRAGGGSEEEEEEEEEKPKKGGFVKKPAADEDEKPKKTAKKPAEDEDEKPKKTAKKPAADEDEKPKKTAKKPADEEVAAALKPKKEEKPKKVAKPDEEEEEEAEDEGKRGKPKKVARSDEDGEDGEDGEEIEGSVELSPMSAGAMYSPGERAVDAAVGMSFTGRRMAFNFDPARVTQTPAGYKQFVPVPGAYVDLTLYPLAFGHKRKDILRHLGVTLMFDRVLALNAKNPNDGMKLASTEQRYAAGLAFRYPLGTAANAPVVGAALRYGQQQFTIEGMAAIPNVQYTLIDFTGFFQLTLAPKMLLNLSAGSLLPTDAGAITKLAQYGRAKIVGLEIGAGVDYLLTKNIFARGEARLETLGYSFLGEGAKSAGVGGARDTYFGGVLTAGFLY